MCLPDIKVLVNVFNWHKKMASSTLIWHLPVYKVLCDILTPAVLSSNNYHWPVCLYYTKLQSSSHLTVLHWITFTQLNMLLWITHLPTCVTLNHIHSPTWLLNWISHSPNGLVNWIKVIHQIWLNYSDLHTPTSLCYTKLDIHLPDRITKGFSHSCIVDKRLQPLCLSFR